jgi:hypothetical protein
MSKTNRSDLHGNWFRRPRTLNQIKQDLGAYEEIKDYMGKVHGNNRTVRNRVPTAWDDLWISSLHEIFQK